VDRSTAESTCRSRHDRFFSILLEVTARHFAEALARWRQTRLAWNDAAAVRTAVIMTLVLALSLSSCAVSRAMAQESTGSSRPAGHHDPSAPFNTWALCIDSSRSVRPDQFVRMRQILQRLVETAVSYNDLVWLIEIRDYTRSARLYDMPRKVMDRTRAVAVDSGLRQRKSALVDAVSRLQQRAGSTDLSEPVSFALTLLATKPTAVLKTIVIGSDFVSDTGRLTTPFPPASLGAASAAGMRVALVVTEPKDEYLQKLKLSGMGLFAIVKERWVAHFITIGAARVTAQPADAVPVS
jgi:hypothetical protein